MLVGQRRHNEFIKIAIHTETCYSLLCGNSLRVSIDNYRNAEDANSLLPLDMPSKKEEPKKASRNCSSINLSWVLCALRVCFNLAVVTNNVPEITQICRTSRSTFKLIEAASIRNYSTVMLLDQNNSSHSNDTASLVAPDSPTFRVFDDDDKNFESNSLSDLALNVSAPYLTTITDPLSCDTESGADLSEEDTSLVLARNNLSTSFSNWEFDPEDASFHNSNQFLLPDDDYEVAYEPQKKRVHFMADPSDTKLIYCEQFDCPIKLTVDDISSGWYTALEIKRFRRHVHKDARALRNLSSSIYMDKFIELHRGCARSIPLTQSRSQVTLASFVSSSQHRGQETLIFYELFHTERKRMVKDLLLAQAACRSSYSTDDLSTMLATASKSLSRRSRRFAYMTGLGDAEISWKQTNSKELKLITMSTRKAPILRYKGDETLSTEQSSSEEDLGHIEI